MMNKKQNSDGTSHCWIAETYWSIHVDHLCGDMWGLCVFFDTSHLGTAVVSIRTRTHTPNSHILYAYKQSYNYTQNRSPRPCRYHWNRTRLRRWRARYNPFVVPRERGCSKLFGKPLFPVGNHAAERAQTRDRWPPPQERTPPELCSVPKYVFFWSSLRQLPFGGCSYTRGSPWWPACPVRVYHPLVTKEGHRSVSTSNILVLWLKKESTQWQPIATDELALKFIQ
jgi:hypothetical protein